MYFIVDYLFREDGSKFGSVVDSGEPYGPFTLYSQGLSNVPGLNKVRAIDKHRQF